MTAAQRSVAAALLFALAALVAGVAPGDEGVRYAVFGAVEGLFALLLAQALVARGFWPRPGGVTGWLALAYGTLAAAQLLEFLLPPPGVVEWVVVIGLLFSAWGLFGSGGRRRIAHSLAAVAVLLALIRYSVVPRLWTLGPEAGTGLGLGNLAEGVRSALAEPRPAGAAAQLCGVLAAVLWAAATRLLWVPAADRGGSPDSVDSGAPTV
jgi:hypothetical protein